MHTRLMKDLQQFLQALHARCGMECIFGWMRVMQQEDKVTSRPMSCTIGFLPVPNSTSPQLRHLVSPSLPW